MSKEKTYVRKNEAQLKTVTVGDVLTQTDEQGKPKEIIMDEEGNETPKLYYLKARIPEGVDEAGIGEPSMVIKNGDYFNFKIPDDEELEKMPDWKKEKIQLICWKKKQD